MPEVPFIVAAYTVFWTVLAGYAYYLSRRARRAHSTGEVDRIL
ncbi:MAG: CcmD family protein [Gemmatimonadaceae bacterium]